MGWNQDALAARLGTSQGTITRIENGKFRRISSPLFRLFDLVEAGLLADAPPASGENSQSSAAAETVARTEECQS